MGTRILQLPDVREKLAANDFEPVGNTPDEFAAFIRNEMGQSAKGVTEPGAKDG